MENNLYENEIVETVVTEEAPVTETAEAPAAPKAKKSTLWIIIAAVCLVALLAVAGIIVIPEIMVGKVEALIDSIGIVTINSQTTIEEAREKYDSLSEFLQKKVSNRSVLTAAEKELEAVKTYETNKIKNYEYFSASYANSMDLSIDKWRENEYYEALLYVFMLLNIQVEGEDLDFNSNSQYICVCKEDNRIDMYATYKGNMIMGIQYWPKQKTAQWGSVKTNLNLKEYVKMLEERDIVDDYTVILSSALSEAVSILKEVLA